jgi:pimeloyl-ACP methyl ester carboxylesterase
MRDDQAHSRLPDTLSPGELIEARIVAAISVPVLLMVSEDGLPVFAEIARRFAKRLGVDVAAAPGTHATYHEHPHELAELTQPFLRDVTS